MDWWQPTIILSGIGLISIVVGIIAGVPLSNIIIRRKNQASIANKSVSFEFEHQHTTKDQLDELLRKYGLFELNKTETCNEETAEERNHAAETTTGQVEPIAIEQLLVELARNLDLAIDPQITKLKPFQTDIWDTIVEIPETLTSDLKWQLTEVYLDIYEANNIIWFLTQFNGKSPELDDQYVGVCTRISDRLNRIVPVLKTASKALPK